jgi:hypothetical protein
MKVVGMIKIMPLPGVEPWSRIPSTVTVATELYSIRQDELETQ